MIFRKNKPENKIIFEEKSFWDKESEKSLLWISKIEKNKFINRLKKKSVWWHRYIKPLHNKIILDLGCGTEDNYTSYLILSGNKLVGVDLSENTIKINKFLLDKLGIKSIIFNSNKSIDVKRIFNRKKNLRAILVVANAEDLPFKNKQFDAIHIKWILHHTQSIPHALKSVNKSLKIGGLFICTESNLLHPPRWITQVNFLRSINIFRYLAIKYGPLDPNEMARTPNAYLKMIKKAGFEIDVVDFKHEFECFYYVARLFIKNKLILNIAKKMDRFILLFEFPKYFAMDIKILARKVKDI